MRKLIARIITWALREEIAKQDYILRTDFDAVREQFNAIIDQFNTIQRNGDRTANDLRLLFDHLKLEPTFTDLQLPQRIVQKKQNIKHT